MWRGESLGFGRLGSLEAWETGILKGLLFEVQRKERMGGEKLRGMFWKVLGFYLGDFGRLKAFKKITAETQRPQRKDFHEAFWRE